MISEPGTAILLSSLSSMDVSNKLIKNKKCLQRISGFIFLLFSVNNKKMEEFFLSRLILIFEGAVRYFKFEQMLKQQQKCPINVKTINAKQINCLPSIPIWEGVLTYCSLPHFLCAVFLSIQVTVTYCTTVLER